MQCDSRITDETWRLMVDTWWKCVCDPNPANEPENAFCKLLRDDKRKPSGAACPLMAPGERCRGAAFDCCDGLYGHWWHNRTAKSAMAVLDVIVQRWREWKVWKAREAEGAGLKKPILGYTQSGKPIVAGMPVYTITKSPSRHVRTTVVDGKSGTDKIGLRPSDWFCFLAREPSEVFTSAEEAEAAVAEMQKPPPLETCPKCGSESIGSDLVAGTETLYHIGDCNSRWFADGSIGHLSSTCRIRELGQRIERVLVQRNRAWQALAKIEDLVIGDLALALAGCHGPDDCEEWNTVTQTAEAVGGGG